MEHLTGQRGRMPGQVGIRRSASRRHHPEAFKKLLSKITTGKPIQHHPKRQHLRRPSIEITDRETLGSALGVVTLDQFPGDVVEKQPRLGPARLVDARVDLLPVAAPHSDRGNVRHRTPDTASIARVKFHKTRMIGQVSITLRHRRLCMALKHSDFSLS